MSENFDVKGLSEYLAGRSHGAIRNLVLRRKIPFRKVEGRLFFLKSEIDEWIKNSPGVSLVEINNGT